MYVSKTSNGAYGSTWISRQNTEYIPPDLAYGCQLPPDGLMAIGHCTVEPQSAKDPPIEEQCILPKGNDDPCTLANVPTTGLAPVQASKTPLFFRNPIYSTSSSEFGSVPLESHHRSSRYLPKSNTFSKSFVGRFGGASSLATSIARSRVHDALN